MPMPPSSVSALLPAEELVLADPALERVTAGAALEGVVPGAAVEDVVAAAARKPVVGAVADDGVAPVGADDVLDRDEKVGPRVRPPRTGNRSTPRELARASELAGQAARSAAGEVGQARVALVGGEVDLDAAGKVRVVDRVRVIPAVEQV
jgi:hypothetical protein